MSPPPTRPYRRNGDYAAGDVCRRHPNADAHVGRPQGAIERTQPGHGIGIGLRNARTRTATGTLTDVQDVRHMNEGRHDGMPRELTLTTAMSAEFP